MRRKNRESSNRSKLLGTRIAELLKPIALAVVAGLSGIVATAMTPLSDVVNSLIWREEPKLQVSPSDVSVRQGEVVRLSVFLYPLSKVPISPGTVTIEYPRDILRLGAETSEGDLVRGTSKAELMVNVTEKIPIEFVAHLPGEGKVKAMFAAPGGVAASVEVPVTVAPRSEQRLPTFDRVRQVWDISGTWNIVLAGVAGQMSLQDEGGNVTGRYFLRDGNDGLLEGFHDGGGFYLFFHRGDKPTQLRIDGDPIGKNPKSEIQIKGRVHLQVPSMTSESGWEDREYGNGKFEAAARTG